MAEHYRSSDGLMSSSDPAAVAQWEAIGARMAAEKASWTDILRARGVKYAHPDDGWVDRDRTPPSHTRSWYPQFDDRPEVGDLIAFGRPPAAYDGEWYRANHDHPSREFQGRDRPEAARSGYRICRVTAVDRHASILGYHQSFEYEDTGERMPSRRPPKWRRMLRKALRFSPGQAGG